MSSTLVHSQSTSLLSPTSTPARPSREFLPLSNHGMPKAPSSGSQRSQRPHRFSSIPPPVQITPSSPPMTPMSPSPMMSPPPLSGMSFDTYIDTEPSTPSFSPRSASTWESSMLAPLSPMYNSLSPIESSPATPASPSEPVWEMITPDPNRGVRKPAVGGEPALEKLTSLTSLTSHPPSPWPVYLDAPQPKKFNPVPKRADEEKENQVQDSKSKLLKEESSFSVAIPLEKLATRMKSILKRKTTTASKRKPRKKKLEYEDLDRMEDVHWTEM